MTPLAEPSIWEPPSWRELLRWPLPSQGMLASFVLRGLALQARRQILAVNGLAHVDADRDPFVLALNHNMRTESMLVPALLVLYRHGRLIHFLADWNYRLIPGIGLVYRWAETITVANKPARPRAFTIFRGSYRRPPNALARARICLASGRSVGVFPEGRLNRDPVSLLTGRRGAAYLSLQSGCPVVPAGIRFPGSQPVRPISDRALMELHIGAPLHPPWPGTERPSPGRVRDWHAVVMTEIARLSGKDWKPSS